MRNANFTPACVRLANYRLPSCGRAILRCCFLLFLLALPLPRASAAEPPAFTLSVRGEVDNPLSLTLTNLQSLPQISIQARDRDGTQSTFTGVALWELVNRAKPRFGEKPAAGAAKTCLVVRAADDFQAVFALAEIDPEFTDHQIILALQRDGQPLPAAQGPLRLIVPGEKAYTRWVRQVTSLEVVRLDQSTAKAMTK